MPPAAADNIILLEEPLIRTSYELLRRSHRSAQRQVEKDFNAVNTGLQALLKSISGKADADSCRETAVAKLEQISERAKGLKRKLEDNQPSAKVPSDLRSRLAYLERVAPGATTDSKKPRSKSDANRKVESPTKRNGTGDEDEVMKEAPVAAPPVAVTHPSARPENSIIDRYIIDYLLRKGRLESAKALSEQQALNALVDLKLFTELDRIGEALIKDHSCTEALAWCGENRGTLKKNKSDLEFTLRFQEYIELCRKREIASAITYSRKNLTGWAATHMADIQKGMTLLAFGERTDVGVYRNLYDQSRWETVRTQFRETFLDIYAQPSQSLLALSLSAGLAALRLPSCVHAKKRPQAKEGSDNDNERDIPHLTPVPPFHLSRTMDFPSESSMHVEAPPEIPSSQTTDLDAPSEAVTANVDCPTCDENMRVLAAEVPMSHHVNSSIVCRISGDVMDSNNEPMAFPNGYVYSSKALEEMARINFDVVTCPRTRETCAFSKLRKVYIS